NERYLFFLDAEGGKNPNYKLVTAYKLTEDGVSALDHGAKFQEHNNRKKSGFMKLVLDASKGNDIAAARKGGFFTSSASSKVRARQKRIWLRPPPGLTVAFWYRPYSRAGLCSSTIASKYLSA